MKSKSLLLFLFALIVSELRGQPVSVNGWQTHLAYSDAVKIAQTPQKVYAVSNGALFSVAKDSSKEIREYSKITGLSDNSIVNIAYSLENTLLMIAYENGNIDLLYDNSQIVNIPDIYLKTMTSDKKINDILFYNGFAYLSCTFGIVKLNLERMEIADTYFIGNNGTMAEVKSLSVLDGKFWAVMADDILTAATEGVNLVNYANWQKLQNVPSGENGRAVVYFADLYLLKSDGYVHILRNNNWLANQYSAIKNICQNSDALFLTKEADIIYINGSNSTAFATSYVPNWAELDGSIVWTAASWAGIGVIDIATHALKPPYKPNGPVVNDIGKLKFAGEKLFAVPGGRWDVPYLRAGHIMIYENGIWKNIPYSEILPIAQGKNCLDLIDIAIDAKDSKHFYAASFDNGIFEFRNDKPYMFYNSDNSGVEAMSGTDNEYYFQRIGSLALDKDNRLWFSNPVRQEALMKILLPNGQTISLKNDGLNDVATPADIIIDKNNPNYKYVVIAREGNGTNVKGIFAAFDDRGTPENTDDDNQPIVKNSFFDQDGKLFSGNLFYCGVQDTKNGSLWLGTGKGPIILPNPHKIFEGGNFICQRIKIPRNDGTNYADYLLETDVITAIAIDGGNRKWLGSETTGVYLMSEDGTEMIHHFTAENSPLLSNNITSIAINDNTGEVFFGTGKGLISFRSDAIKPKAKFTNLHAYPNPVRENYHGLISITGLVENTIVKITDISGNLIYETISKGGMVTWSGNRYDGKRVSTGVYLAICTAKDGSESAVCKILVIN